MSWKARMLNSGASRGVALFAACSLVCLYSVAAAEEDDGAEEAEEAEIAGEGEAEEAEEPVADDLERIPGPGDVEYQIDGDEVLIIQDGEEVGAASIACSGAAAVKADYLYVACGERGVLLVSLDEPRSPTTLALTPMDGDVTSLSVLDERLWLEYADGSGVSIVPSENFDAVADAVDEEDVPDDAPHLDDVEDDEEVIAAGEIGIADEEDDDVDEILGLEGRIIEVRDGAAVIDLGREDGLTTDHRVELYDIEYVRVGGEEIAEERGSGVGKVQTLGDSHAEVTLPLNVRVHEGMRARVTDQGATMQPAPRLANVLTVDAAIRPFLPIDALGVGALAEFGMGYHFSGPWIFEVRLDPVGLTVTGSDTDDIQTFAANAMISFVGDNFQVGLGTGLSRVHWRAHDRRLDEEPTEENVGVGAVQYVRLGQMEDVHLSLTTNVVVVDRAWQFGGAMLQGEAPATAIGDNMWFLGRIGGGVPGHFLLELGLRQLVAGNGGPGSVFITPTVGFGSIQQDAYEVTETQEGDQQWNRDTVGYSGPMIGIGAEWRQ